MKSKSAKGSARTKKFLNGGAVGALAGLGTLAYLMSRDKKDDSSDSESGGMSKAPESTSEKDSIKKALTTPKTDTPKVDTVKPTPPISSSKPDTAPKASTVTTTPAAKPATPKPITRSTTTITPPADNDSLPSKKTPLLTKPNEDRPSKPYPINSKPNDERPSKPYPSNLKPTGDSASKPVPSKPTKDLSGIKPISADSDAAKQMREQHSQRLGSTYASMYSRLQDKSIPEGPGKEALKKATDKARKD